MVRKKWPFRKDDIFDDWFDYFGFGNDIFDEFEEHFRKMQRWMNQMARDAMSGKLPSPEEGGPYVYGWSLRVGPDGKPHFQEFGNVPSVAGAPRAMIGAREPLVEEDIDLEITGDTLIIRVDKDERKYYKEVELPCEVDADSAKASYQNGVLDIELKKVIKMKENEKVVVKVAEAKTRDVGRGIGRIDPAISEKMGLTSGDVIIIEGKKRTACLFWPGYPEDYGKGIIRIDGTIRRNAGVGIDDKVEIRKAVAKKAERITLAPTEELKIMGGEEYLSQILEGRVITQGDVIELNIMGRKIDLVVTKISPMADAVIIERDTSVSISEKPAKEEMKIPRITYEDIGGLEEEIKQVRGK